MGEGFGCFVFEGLHGLALGIDVAPFVAFFDGGNVRAKSARIVVFERDDGFAFFVEVAAFARFAGDGEVVVTVFRPHEAVQAVVFQRHGGFAVAVYHAVAPVFADDGECVVVEEQAHLIKFPGGVRLALGIDVSPVFAFAHRRQGIGDVVVVHVVKLGGDNNLAGGRVKKAFFAVLAEDAQCAADDGRRFDAFALRYFERSGAGDGVGACGGEGKREEQKFWYGIHV